MIEKASGIKGTTTTGWTTNRTKKIMTVTTIITIAIVDVNKGGGAIATEKNHLLCLLPPQQLHTAPTFACVASELFVVTGKSLNPNATHLSFVSFWDPMAPFSFWQYRWKRHLVGRNLSPVCTLVSKVFIKPCYDCRHCFCVYSACYRNSSSLQECEQRCSYWWCWQCRGENPPAIDGPICSAG